MSTKRREGCPTTQADSHFTSVLDVRWARNDERVATTTYKIRISPQFWRPTTTKWREGCAATCKIRISPQFRTSDDHEVTRGLRGDLKIRISPQFWTSDEHETTRGWSPVLIDQTHPALKKKENFKEVLIHNHSQQIFSADFFSRSSQQIFSAEFLSRSFSADLLSRSSQQIFSFAVVRGWWSAIVLSFLSFAVVRVGGQLLSYHLLWSVQQIFSADFLSRVSQQIFLSRSSQQIFSADLLICCGQGLVVSYCLIILIICCGQGLVVSYCLIICCGQFSRSSQQIFSAEFLSRSFSADLLSRSSQQIFSFAVVRGWWSAIVLSFLSFAVVRGWWSAIVLSFLSCCQGLVVSYCLIMLVVYTAWVL